MYDLHRVVAFGTGFGSWRILVNLLEEVTDPIEIAAAKLVQSI